jgi:hypothetical protein
VTASGLLWWITLGGLLVLLISEAALALIPYVKQAVEGGLLEAARKTGVVRKRSKDDPAQIEEDREGSPGP